MAFEHTETSHKLENEYPKLVRDKIPARIKERDGIEAKVRVLDDEEFEYYLLKKVAEEAEELSKSETAANIKEELADVFEVIEALLEVTGITMEEVKALQAEKRDKRGGFKERLLMLAAAE